MVKLLSVESEHAVVIRRYHIIYLSGGSPSQDTIHYYKEAFRGNMNGSVGKQLSMKIK